MEVLKRATLTREETARLDRLAATCQRCNSWLGRLLTIGVIRKPDDEALARNRAGDCS